MSGNEALDQKTRNFILYLIDKMAIPTKTGIMKMSYLCDLAAIKSGLNQITDFEYIRYYYGPFDRKIEEYLLDLIKTKYIVSKSEYSSGGGEYEKFSLSQSKKDLDEEYSNNLNAQEQEIVDSILDSLGSFNAKILTDIAYKTNPMTKIGAKLGGIEHLTEKLDLTA